MAHRAIMAHLDSVKLDSKIAIRADWVLEGKPLAIGRDIAASKDGSTWVMAWECTAGRFKWVYTEDEIAHITAGEVFITENEEGNGPTFHLIAGDMMFFPAGTTYTWYVRDHVRKLAVCHRITPLFLRLAWSAMRRISGWRSVISSFRYVSREQSAGPIRE
jgi:uncharacterized cupin superfamily protein